MHSLFNVSSISDKSLFKYSNTYFMERRIFEYYNKYVTDRKIHPGRVKSNHLFITLLWSMDGVFEGDLQTFLSKSSDKAMQLSRTLGLTTAYNPGKIFKDTLYSGCDEIIIQARDNNLIWLDLWSNWRNVSSVKVISHPVTDLTVFELGVMNDATISNPDLAIFTVDLAVMHLQWEFYKASTDSATYESFLAEVVFPNAFKSHLDIVPFNRLMARRGLRPYSSVESNLPFNQQSITQELDRILTIVENNITGRRLYPNQYLSAIPTIFGENYLTEVKLPDVMPTSQVLWALLMMRVERLQLLLDIGKVVEWARFDELLARLKRSMIEYSSSNVFGSGLNKSDSSLVSKRLRDKVLDLLPFEVDDFR